MLIFLARPTNGDLSCTININSTFNVNEGLIKYRLGGGYRRGDANYLVMLQETALVSKVGSKWRRPTKNDIVQLNTLQACPWHVNILCTISCHTITIYDLTTACILQDTNRKLHGWSKIFTRTNVFYVVYMIKLILWAVTALFIWSGITAGIQKSVKKKSLGNKSHCELPAWHYYYLEIVTCTIGNKKWISRGLMCSPVVQLPWRQDRVVGRHRSHDELAVDSQSASDSCPSMVRNSR